MLMDLILLRNKLGLLKLGPNQVAAIATALALAAAMHTKNYSVGQFKYTDKLFLFGEMFCFQLLGFVGKFNGMT